MLRASDRTFSRRDTVSFLVCLGLSTIGLFLPDPNRPRTPEAFARVAETLNVLPVPWVQPDAVSNLVANAVTGVAEGFKKELDIVGVGYRAELKGKQVHFALGYSHPIVFDIPNGIDIAVDKQTHITVTGVDRQLVGQVAANIRRLREPDPYKQKGVRYTGEVLKKKAGKTGAK